MKNALAMLALLIGLSGAAFGQAEAPATVVVPAEAGEAAVVPTAPAVPAVIEPAAAPQSRAELEARLAASPMTRLLNAMPADVRSFVAMSDLPTVAGGTRIFQEKTGLALPLQPEDLTNLLTHQVGLRGGVSDKDPMAVISLDPIAYRGRDTVFLVPVQGREEFLQYNGHEEVEQGLYRLTTIEAPRFFAFIEGYAVFSESMRTTLAMRDGARGVGHTMTTQQHSAMANSHLYMHFNMARTLAGNREAVEKFRQATMMRVLGDPVLKSYSDLLLGYMTGINEVITQANVLDLGVRFHEDEVELAAFASFIDGGSIRAAMRQAGAGEPALTANLPDDVHMVSAFSVALRPEMVRSAGMGVLDFILQNSPNARRKLRGETRERLMKSAEELFGQMTGQMASMTALPKVETQAAEATLTIFQIRDKMAFVTARDDFFRMVGVAGEELAAPIAFRYATDQEKYRDVMIDYLRPQFNYPDTRYEELFRLRMQSHYGLDGYVYRMAIVKNLVMVSVGSDVTLLRAAIDKALDVAEPTVATSIAAARDGVPAGASVTYFGSLPAMLSRSIIQAGEASGASMGLAFTEEDKAIIRSQGLMGFGISLVDGNMVATSRMSYEQIAGAVKLADRHLPPMVPPVEPTPEPRRVEPTPEPSTEPVPEPVPQPTPEPTAEPAPLPDVTPEAAPEPTPEPTLEVDRGWMVP